MAITIIIKDSSSTINYTFNAINWLTPGDTIETVDWSVPTQVLTGTQIEQATSFQIVIKGLQNGGTPGTPYQLEYTVETVAGKVGLFKHPSSTFLNAEVFVTCTKIAALCGLNTEEDF